MEIIYEMEFTRHAQGCDDVYKEFIVHMSEDEWGFIKNLVKQLEEEKIRRSSSDEINQ